MAYIGYSRSARSQIDIDNYIVPLSHIKIALIKEFIEANPEYYDVDFPATIWKHCGKHLTGPASWHHVSKFYNKVEHYDLAEIAEELKKRGDFVKKHYEIIKARKSRTFL